MLEHCCGDLLPFSHSSISEVGHWCWTGSQSAFQIIPKVFIGVEVRALCRPVKFFHTDLDKPFLYGPRFVHRGIVMLNQEIAFPKLLPQSWKHRKSSRMSLYAAALRFPFSANKGPSPNHEKQSQTIIPLPPNFTIETMHLDRQRFLATAKPPFVRRTAKWRSVIHHSREHVSTAPETNGSKLFTTPADAWWA
jgi:hypothetical protein